MLALFSLLIFTVFRFIYNLQRKVRMVKMQKMKISERMKNVFKRSRELAMNPPQNTFDYDYQYALKNTYAELPIAQRTAKAMAYAVVNQPVYVEEDDRIIGRVYYHGGKDAEADPDFDIRSVFREFRIACSKDKPDYRELAPYGLITYDSPGHIAWNWNDLLIYGTDGIRKRIAVERARKANDQKSVEFYDGVTVMLDALDEWNEKHIALLDSMGKTDEAQICRQVPRFPARSFREAVQCFFMQFIVVMKENPHGGNSPGRLDYYLWPFLERDLKNGKCTLEEARELVEELFIRIDERLYYADGWGESVSLGGCHPNGTSAVNPLSHIMIEAFMKYDLTHPYLYARIPTDAPEEWLHLCADYVMNGSNRAQLLNDEGIMKALVHNGVPYADASNYYCGGCMEVGVQGKTSDLLFTGYHNIAKLVELCLTGGYSLNDGKQLKYFKCKPITEIDTFDEFYDSVLAEAKRIMWANLRHEDELSEYIETHRPSYLISAMVDDCISRGRNMHGGGARYHDYGASFIGVPNAIDSLIAVKKAVYEDKICTASELLDALKANFEGYEALRRVLLKLPKYGQDNAEADAMAARFSEDICNIYATYENRFGGNGKPIILTFTWAAPEGAKLGASPDGRKAGVPIAQSMTPQGSSMTNGITAAMNSCTSLPYDYFTGGASTMWDLDSSWATESIVESLFVSFFANGGHIFQGNVTDIETLRKAQIDPENYNHVIVRVGGYSARFINLSENVQNDIINRMRHRG